MSTEIGKAYVQIMPSAKGIKGNLEKELGGGVGDSVGQSLGGQILSGAKKLLAAGAIAEVIKASIMQGAALEQSIGGVETLFKDHADTVISNAKKAYKTAGVSANQYMEQVTSFSASLIQSLEGDTQKAAKYADMAMVDMSDNANKFGSNIQDIQNAYQGFAKQNYTMLDNLKLGYGGTKTEMERLLSDAEAISGVHYDISNYSDVVEAIHVIQEEMGITGTTATEAGTTVSGSFAMMRASADDLLGAIAKGWDLQPYIDNLLTSIGTFAGNVLPMIGNIVGGIVTYFMQNAPQMLAAGMEMLAQLSQGLVTGIPEFINNAMSLVGDFISGIQQNAPQIIESGLTMLNNLVDGLIEGLPQLIEQGAQLILQFAQIIAENAPAIVTGGMELVGKLIMGIIQAIPSLIASIPTLVQAAITAFTSSNWATAGIQAVGKIVLGLIQAVGQLVGQLASLASQAISKFLSGNWIGSGLQAIGKVVSGIGNAAGRVLTSLRTMASNAIRNFISGNWLSAGFQAISKIVSGITPGAIVGKMRGLAQSALNAFRGTNWASLGSNIISGIVSGIGGAAGHLFSSLTNLASNALSKAKSLLDIGSPSRVFAREVGHWIPAGIAMGVDQNADTLIESINGLTEDALAESESMLNLTRGGKFSGSMNMNYTVDDATIGLQAQINDVVTILGQILSKDTSIYMDGDKVADTLSPRINRRLGMAL